MNKPELSRYIKNTAKGLIPLGMAIIYGCQPAPTKPVNSSSLSLVVPEGTVRPLDHYYQRGPNGEIMLITTDCIVADPNHLSASIEVGNLNPLTPQTDLSYQHGYWLSLAEKVSSHRLNITFQPADGASEQITYKTQMIINDVNLRSSNAPLVLKERQAYNIELFIAGKDAKDQPINAQKPLISQTFSIGCDPGFIPRNLLTEVRKIDPNAR